MSIFERLGKVLTAAAPAQSYVAGDNRYQWSVPKSSSDVATLREFRSWVYAALSAKAKAAAMVDGHLYTPDDNEVEKHPFLDLWAKPCRAWSGTEWREIWYLHRDLSGNSYLEVVTNGLRVPVELMPMRPDLVEVIPGGEFVKGYRYTGSTTQITLEADQVVHSKRANPNSNYYGLSVVQAAAQAVDLNQMMKGYGLATFRNSAAPKTMVKLRDGIPPDQAAAVEALVGDSFKGIANAGRTGIVSNAIEDIKRISLTPEELDYLDGMDRTRDEIFAITGVHRSKVGMADDINRANAEAADYTFKADVIAPEVGALEDMINSEILPRFDKRLVWRFDNPVPDDQDRALARAGLVYEKGIGTENEAREILGMDERPEGERYSKSFAVEWIPAGQNPEPATARAHVETAAAKTSTQARAMLRVVGRHEAQIRAAMADYFRSQRKRVTGNLRNELASWPKLTRATWDAADGETRAEYAAVLQGWKLERGRAGVNEGDEENRLYLLLLPLLIAASAAGQEYVRKLTGQPVTSEPAVVAKARASLVAGIVTSTTVRQLLAALESAATQAEALALIESVFDTALGMRANLIGRVEASGMVNVAARNGLAEAGYGYKQWQTVGDDAVEETCQENSDYGAIPIDAEFPSGDTEPPTAEHFGCRCAIVPATAEDVGVTPEDVFGEAARLG